MQKIVFHSFIMGDVDDPEIYAAPALYKWKQTEQGQWVMEHCADPRYELHPDPSFMGHQVVILGELEDQEATFYQLKWKNANINR